MFSRSPALASFTLAALLAGATCSSTTATSTNSMLIVDKTFDLKTADPQRELSVTGAMISKALYDTLPSVAISHSSSENARRFTFKLRRDVVFSDGSRLTSADVVFSLERIAKLNGAPSGLLSGVNASAPDAFTIVLTSNDPNPQLPSTLTNPALGIVSSSMVDGEPDGYLDATSAGSGPYMLKSFSTYSDIAGSDPALESLGAQASTTADEVTRRQLLQQLQGQLNQDGPIFPLVQPGRVIVTTADIATIDYNPTWSVDLATVTG